MSLFLQLRFKHLVAVGLLAVAVAAAVWRFADLQSLWQQYASAGNTAVDKSAGKPGDKPGDKAKYTGGRPGNKDMGEGGGKPTPVSTAQVKRMDMQINVQALGVGISEALTGKKTAEAALNDLVGPVSQIMREAGYKI